MRRGRGGVAEAEREEKIDFRFERFLRCELLLQRPDTCAARDAFQAEFRFGGVMSSVEIVKKIFDTEG